MPNPTRMANAIRALAMDAVQKAHSGHPGAPMGMAEIAVALWGRHLKHNPASPGWMDRDRFVLSNGHGSMLLYALLHLTGYDLPMAELEAFRQLGSKTAGHPEVDITQTVVAAHPVDELNKRSDDFDLLVLGVHGSALPVLSPGATIRAVMAYGHCPLGLVRERKR